MSSISGLATDIYNNELDATGVTLASVSGWLSENLGMLNTYLYESFSGVEQGNGDTLVSGLNLEEQDIYKEFYLYHYYTKQARNSLRGIANNENGHLLSVSDGDNSVSFVNRNEVSKVYKGLATDSYNKSLRLVQSYNSFRANPRQVGGVEANLTASGYYL
jgi:hypothetical protein